VTGTTLDERSAGLVMVTGMRRAGLAAAGLVLVVACDRTPAPSPVASSPPLPVSSTPAVTPSASPTPSALAADHRGSGKAVTIAFGGDVHFQGASASALRGGLRPITPALSAADVTMVNLETAITARGTRAPKEFNFRAPPAAFTALRAAGVDVVTEANNHGMDYGLVGLRDSVAAAKAARFPVVGIGLDDDQAYAPWRTTVKGQRLAFFGATQVLDSNLVTAWTAGPGKPGLASAYEEAKLLGAVRAARATSDTVVVYLHWGQERSSCPIARQPEIARKLAAAGADIVVGSHAHVLLGAGMLGRAFVSYGLGNFVFYARGGLGAQTGVLTVTITGRHVDGYRWAPAVINGGVPYPLTGTAAEAARRRWTGLRGCTGLAA
jgi:poly-gamma-glutamate capsule biosynthesis protein CapA/YwtB (metallophosphatase superfamily)